MTRISYWFFMWKISKSRASKNVCFVKADIYTYPHYQGCSARKVNCSCVYSAYISSLWVEFANKNRCLSVRLVPGGGWKHWILIIHIIVSYDQNIFHWFFLCEKWIPCQTVASVLCLHYRPETVHCSTKDAYTSEITFLALHPWYTVVNHTP